MAFMSEDDHDPMPPADDQADDLEDGGVPDDDDDPTEDPAAGADRPELGATLGMSMEDRDQLARSKGFASYAEWRAATPDERAAAGTTSDTAEVAVDEHGVKMDDPARG